MSSDLNNTKTTTIYNSGIKGINECYNCKSTDLIHDEFRDEIICNNCKHVLKQAFYDFKQHYKKPE